MGTIIAGLVLLGIVAAIIVKIYRDKKKGRCAGCSLCCGSNCKIPNPPCKARLQNHFQAYYEFS